MVSRDAEILLRRLEENPDDVGAFTQLVNLYQAAGDVRSLASLYERRADDLAKRGADPAEISGLHLDAGEIYEKQLGRQDRALQHYRKAFEQDPTCVPALYAAREIYRSSGNLKAAAVLYDLEANAEPDPTRRVALYRELAYVRYQDLGDLDGGLVALQRALALSPQDVAVLTDIAPMLLARAERATEVPGGEEAARTDRARAASCWAELAMQSPPAEAIALAETALDAFPGHEGALVTLDEKTRETGGDVATLAPRYRAFLEAAPDAELAASVRRTLGYIAMQKGYVDEAIRCFEAIGNPDDTEVAGWLAELRARAGRPASRPPSKPPSKPPVAVPEPAPKPLPEKPASRPSISSGAPQDVVSRLRKEAGALIARGADDEAALRMAEILEIDSADPEATGFLEDYYGDRQDWGALREVMMLAVRVPGAPLEVRKTRLRQVATIAEERQKDFAGAAAAWRASLSLDPTDARVRENLHRTLAAGGLWDEMVKVLDKELLSAADRTEKLRVAKRLGEVHQRERKDPAAAVPYWKRVVELDPADASARSALEDCLEASEAYDELVARLREAADAAKDPAVATLNRKKAARVLHEKVGDPEGAFAECKKAIVLLPDDEEALARMETIDETEESWDRLAETYAHRLDRARDVDSKVMCLARIARLAEERIGDDARAIDTWRRALDQRPADPEALEAAERLLDRHGRFDDVREVLEAALAVTTDVGARSDLHRKLATLYDGALADPEKARAEWERVLEAGEDAEALRALLAHADRDGRVREVVDLLRRIDARTEDKAERSALLLRRASLQAKELADDEGAAESLRKLLGEVDPDSADALAFLRDVEQRRGNLREAAKAAEKEAALRTEPAAKKDVLSWLGQTQRSLGERAPAIRAFEGVREIDAKDTVARDALEALYAEAGEHEKLLALHRERAGEESGRTRAARLRRMAEVAETGAKDANRAFELLQEAFDLDRSDPDVLDEIRALATRAKLYDPLVALLTDVSQRVEGRERASRLEEISTVFEKLVFDPSRALESLLQAFQLDPDDWSYLDGVDRIATAGALFERVGHVYEALVRRESDPQKKAALLRRYASVMRNGQKDASAAMDLEVRALAQQPTDPDILGAIEELAAETERHEDLLIVYDRLRSIAPHDDQPRWLLKSYRVAVQKTSDAEHADQLLRQALKTGPDRSELHLEAEKVAADVDAAAPAEDRMRGTRALVVAYREVASQLDTPSAQGRLLARAARMTEHALDDLRAAFEGYVEAISTDPGGPGPFVEAERLAGELGDFKTLAATYETILRDAIDPVIVRPIRRRFARMLAHHLDRAEEAADQLWRIVQVDPSETEARADLEALWEKHGRWNDLLLLLERDRGGSHEEKLARARRIARIWDQKLQNHYEAMDAWQDVLKLEPGDDEAKEALAKLRSAEKHAEDEDDDLFRSAEPPPKFELEADEPAEREEAAPPPAPAPAPPTPAPPDDGDDAIVADDAIVEEEALDPESVPTDTVPEHDTRDEAPPPSKKDE